MIVANGEMRRAIIVGCRLHESQFRHGLCSTDTNNVVLLDNEGNPLGNRILAPIPSTLRANASGEYSKILAIATKFI